MPKGDDIGPHACHLWSVFKQSMPPDLVRGWKPAGVTKPRFRFNQNGGIQAQARAVFAFAS